MQDLLRSRSLRREHDDLPAGTGGEQRVAVVRESAAERRAWPWAFRATQTFALRAVATEGATLAQKLTLENTGSEPFPFGLGWHPFFVASTDSVLGFEAAHTSK